MKKLLAVLCLSTGSCATLSQDPPHRTAAIFTSEAAALVIASTPGGLPLGAVWLGLAEWARRQPPHTSED